jgi:hypothetical protein
MGKMRQQIARRSAVGQFNKTRLQFSSQKFISEFTIFISKFTNAIKCSYKCSVV